MDEFGRPFALRHILYFPDAEQSMLSTMRLQEEGGQLIFKGTNCVARIAEPVYNVGYAHPHP